MSYEKVANGLAYANTAATVVVIPMIYSKLNDLEERLSHIEEYMEVVSNSLRNIDPMNKTLEKNTKDLESATTVIKQHVGYTRIVTDKLLKGIYEACNGDEEILKRVNDIISEGVQPPKPQPKVEQKQTQVEPEKSKVEEQKIDPDQDEKKLSNFLDQFR